MHAFITKTTVLRYVMLVNRRLRQIAWLWAPSPVPGASSFGTRRPIRTRGPIRTGGRPGRTRGRPNRTRGRPLWISGGPSWTRWRPLRMLFRYGLVLAGASPTWSGSSGSGNPRLPQRYRFAGSFLRATTTHSTWLHVS